MKNIKDRMFSKIAVNNRYSKFDHINQSLSSNSSSHNLSIDNSSFSAATAVGASDGLLNEEIKNKIKKQSDIWGLNTMILKQNPDFYTLWNHRRERILIKLGFLQDFIIKL